MVHQNKKRGFSLIEMLVSLGVISVAVALGTVVIHATKVMRDLPHEQVAFRIANSKLDELRADGYNALPVGGQFSDSGLMRLPQGMASTSVSDWNARTKKVVTGVSWQGVDGFTRYVSLTTLITEVGGL